MKRVFSIKGVIILGKNKNRIEFPPHHCFNLDDELADRFINDGVMSLVNSDDEPINADGVKYVFNKDLGAYVLDVPIVENEEIEEKEDKQELNEVEELNNNEETSEEYNG